MLLHFLRNSSSTYHSVCLCFKNFFWIFHVFICYFFAINFSWAWPFALFLHPLLRTLELVFYFFADYLLTICLEISKQPIRLALILRRYWHTSALPDFWQYLNFLILRTESIMKTASVTLKNIFFLAQNKIKISVILFGFSLWLSMPLVLRTCSFPFKVVSGVSRIY